MGYKGLKLHLNDPQHLEGYQGDERDDLAEIIIPRQEVGSMSNDIGFRRNENGHFVAVISSYDSSRYGRNTAWEKSVKFNYAEQNIVRAARKQGLRPIHTGKKLANGRVEYKFLKV